MVKHRGDNVCGVLLLNKPSGRSSNFYLQRVKYLFNAKKAGHTGSLDPLATGLLPICFGKATCLSEYFLHSDKTYEAVIQLGVTTSSHDCDGDIVERRDVVVSQDQFDAALRSFVGEIEQVPPMVSALKHKGQPLYKLALKGKEIERKARKMTVHSLSGELLDDNQACIAVHCSSGFYVRQLAADVGEKLGCGAHIIALRRTTSKYLNVESAISFEQLERELSALGGDQQAKQDYIQQHLLPAEDLLQSLPALYVDYANAENVSHGRKIPITDLHVAEGETRAAEEVIGSTHFRLYQLMDGNEENYFLGIAQTRDESLIKIRRLFNAFKEKAS